MIDVAPDAATRWIAALPLEELFAVGRAVRDLSMLPALICPAATLARLGDLARTTLPVDDGRWIRIEAAPLGGDRDGDRVNAGHGGTANVLGRYCGRPLRVDSRPLRLPTGCFRCGTTVASLDSGRLDFATSLRAELAEGG